MDHSFLLKSIQYKSDTFLFHNVINICFKFMIFFIIFCKKHQQLFLNYLHISLNYILIIIRILCHLFKIKKFSKHLTNHTLSFIQMYLLLLLSHSETFVIIINVTLVNLTFIKINFVLI